MGPFAGRMSTECYRDWVENPIASSSWERRYLASARSLVSFSEMGTNNLVFVSATTPDEPFPSSR